MVLRPLTALAAATLLAAGGCTVSGLSSGGGRQSLRDGTGGHGPDAGGDGATPAGGSSGAAGSAGTAGSGGATNSSGAPCNANSDCTGASYCRSDTSQCAPCADLGRLEFGTPQPLAAINTWADGNSQQVDLDSPRADGTQLYFAVSTGASQSSVYCTADFTQSAGTKVVLPGGSSDAEPLPLSSPVALLGNLNFLFDEESATNNGSIQEQLFGGAVGLNGVQVTNVGALPAPLNSPTENSYAIAVAKDTGRAWWMMGSSASVNLYTSGVGNQKPTQVNLTVSPGSCPADFLLDATPWVTPNGKLLFFRSAEQSDNCRTSTGTDLYFARPGANGTSTATATPLAGVNAVNTIDTSPSLSSDLCWLYFASNRESGQSHLRLYRAPRD